MEAQAPRVNGHLACASCACLSCVALFKKTFEVFKPLDVLAQMTQHIPDRYQNLTRYFGWYSCRSRGVRKKAESLDSHKDFTNAQPQGKVVAEQDSDHDADYRKAARRR